MSPISSYGLEVQDITVQPLYPVLDDNGECLGFSQPLHLRSDLKQGETRYFSVNPCTVDMTQPDITFKLHFEDEDVESRFLHVSGHLQHSTKSEPIEITGPGPLEGHRLSKGPNYIAVRLQPFQHGDTLPWGVRGTITWKFIINDNPTSVSDESSFTCTVEHPLEIYAVTPFMGSYKTRPAHLHGMPRKALQFYLIHAMADVPVTIADYVRNIVNAVHADTGYAYDVWSGESRFSGSGKGSGFDFDIGSWARNLRPGLYINAAKMLRQHPSVPREFVGHYVNCYDQAAAVWTGITLALNSLEDAQKLVWRYAQPYGYIKPTRLVGWYHPHSLTNSPYFLGTPGKQHDESPIRTSFWNHAFLEFDQGVLDATCGPHTGSETLEEYFSTSIDYPAAKGRAAPEKKIDPPEDSEATYDNWIVHLSSPDTPKEDKSQATRHGGITAAYLLRNNAPKPVHVPKATSPEGETYSGEMGVKDFSYLFHILSDERIASSIWKRLGIQRPKDDGSHWVFPIDALQSLGGILAGHLGAGTPVDPTSVPPLTVSRLAPDWVHLSWVAVRPTQGKRVAVDLFVLPNTTRASELFATRVWPRIDALDSGYEVEHDSQDGIRAAVKGQGHGSIWRITRNVVYSIQGLNGNAALEPYERAVRDLFKFSDADSEAADRENPLGDISITVHNKNSGDGIEVRDDLEVPCVLNEMVWVIPLVDNGKMLSYNMTNKWVLAPSKSEMNIPDDTAAYIFTTRNKGTDSIQVVACGSMLDISKLKSAVVTLQVK